MTIKSFTVTQSIVGVSDAARVTDTADIRISYAAIITGTVNYTVEHSLDGINYFANSDNTNQTTSQDGNYIFPVKDIRVRINSGAGSIVFTVLQAIT